MNHAWPMALFAYVLLAAPMHAQSLPNDSGEIQIRQLVQQYMDARNSKNGAAIRSLFTTDADQLVSTGEWRKGIAALVQGAMASSRKETGKSAITVESIRLLEPNVAIADGRYETSNAATGQSRSMWTTLVLKHTDLGWRIAAIRNMLPAPNH
ncbi:MAG: SgcJ/EcaC family oxidoreductase [Acidobacteriota bacterium]|nr:SgcJ/EcaC family oxidoreductase [Acidobacteriota bacterium]